MSIIVKGMQLPLSCMECPMFNGIGCKATMKMFSELTNVAVRMKDCPLVEFPEKHGRLIDSDKLIKDLADMWYDNKINLTGVSVSELIRAQEIIIEQEK